VSNSAKPGTLLLIGIAFLAGAAVLAWLSSIASMQLVRTSAETTTVTIDSRLFGLFPIQSERIEQVTAASLVRSRETGSPSHTPDRLVFATSAGPADRGYRQQLFAHERDGIDAFLGDPAAHDVSLTSIDRGSERVRFVAAQLAVLFLACCGVGIFWIGVRALIG
jgi:hypothetical protein